MESREPPNAAVIVVFGCHILTIYACHDITASLQTKLDQTNMKCKQR